MPIWNLDAPQLVDTYDELPLWSAPIWPGTPGMD